MTLGSAVAEPHALNPTEDHMTGGVRTHSAGTIPAGRMV